MSTPIFPMQIKPVKCSFRPVAHAKTFESVFTKTVQSIGGAGQHWVANVEFANVKLSAARELTSFLWSLNGSATPFFIGDWRKQTPQGSGAGTPVIDGTNQTGTLLNIRGGLANDLIFKAGDLIQVGTELKAIVADATTDASGRAALTITPRLRTAPANGAAIISTNPMGLFRLMTDDIEDPSEGKRVLTSLSIELQEAI